MLEQTTMTKTAAPIHPRTRPLPFVTNATSYADGSDNCQQKR